MSITELPRALSVAGVATNGWERNRKGQFVAKRIELKPTFWMGYFCGLVLGDGSLASAKTRNYQIAVESTKKELRRQFIKAVRKISPAVAVFQRQGRVSRSFPNGVRREDMHYSAVINSKKLYQVLRPFKKEDSIWEIPTFLTSRASLRGFLRGIFDAEGCVVLNSSRGRWYPFLVLSSKHQSNLNPIAWLLLRFGIFSHTRRTWAGRFELKISDRDSLKRFAKFINFGLDRKRKKMNEGLNLLLWASSGEVSP